MEENRESNRFDMIGLARIRQGPTDLALEVQIVNISYHGMRIFVKEPVAERVEVSLYYFEDGSGEQVIETIQAAVTWCQAQGIWHAAGISFIDLNIQDHPATFAFLDGHIKIG